MIRNKNRRPFEFQRNGPIARPAGHKPDLLVGGNKRVQSATKRSAITPRRTANKDRETTVDSLFLIDLLGKFDISTLKRIDASGKKLNKVDISTLQELESLTYADFSDNRLPLEPFAALPKLKELDLSCNALKSFDFRTSEEIADGARAWTCLENLNISFNNAESFITELQFLPHLSNLNLSQNSISNLPSNLMHFTCLTHLNLSGNKINSEQSFYSLATITSLQVLILDDNQITHLPEVNFGFEALQEISLKNNKITYEKDIAPLAYAKSLELVYIAKNPIVLRSKNLRALRSIISKTNITLCIDEKPNKVIKKSLPSHMRTVNFDPLTLPTFTKQYKKAINVNKKSKVIRERKTKQPELDNEDLEILANEEVKEKTTSTGTEDSFFLTATNASTETEEPKAIDLPPTELPSMEMDDVEEITSIWSEVPVVQSNDRKALKSSNRSAFLMSFKKLEFLVEHPDLRLRPRESTSTKIDKSLNESTKSKSSVVVTDEERSIFRGSRPRTASKKSQIKQCLDARTENTKEEVQQMLQSMSDRLRIVERDLGVADETGQKATDLALDQKNFTTLQKQYETIRAELINTLNS